MTIEKTSYLHLTYGLPMINDIHRNKFYYEILKNIKDKHCLEIGFGSGILSILALEHGAKSVVAYEEMEDTYRLGVQVIKSLGLEDKITLIGEQFTSDKIKNHPNVECIFTETINHTLWGESLLHVIRHNDLPEMLPSNYFLELHSIEISNNYARRLLTNNNTSCNPGIEINQAFTKTINNILNKDEVQLVEGLHGITIDNLYPVLDVCDVYNRQPEKVYNIDINNPVNLDTVIDWNILLEENKNYLIIPRTGMSYKEKILYTDVCANWGPVARYPLVINAKSMFNFKQNFRDGNIIFSYRDQQVHLIKEEHAHKYNIKETDKTKVINFVH